MATVPVNDTTPRNQYVASAPQSIFDYDFIIFAEADLKVYVDGVLKTLTTHYTITDVLDPDGGTFTFVTPLTGGEIVVALGEIAIERLTDFQPGGQFDPEDLNIEQDKQIAMMKQIKRDLNFHLSFDPSITTVTEGASIIPEPVDDATIAYDGTTGAFKIGPTTAAISAASTEATNAAASAAAALASENAAAADAVLTAADVVSTAADAVSTAADAVSTAADAVSTAADAAAAQVAKIEWQGTYNGATAYELNDAVVYLGSSFINIQAGTGQTPVVGGTAYWDDLANKGVDGSAEVDDSTFRIQDNGDATKEIAFQASGITTGTTRTITMPDADVDLGELGGAWELISSATASSSVSIDFVTGITSGYSKFVIILEGVKHSGFGNLKLVVSADTGSTFESANYSWVGSAQAITAPTNAVNSSDAYINMSPSDEIDSNTIISGIIYVDGNVTSSTDQHGVRFSINQNNSTKCIRWEGSGQWSVNSAIDALRVSTTGTSFAYGNFYLYGIKNT